MSMGRGYTWGNGEAGWESLPPNHPSQNKPKAPTDTSTDWKLPLEKKKKYPFPLQILRSQLGVSGTAGMGFYGVGQMTNTPGIISTRPLTLSWTYTSTKKIFLSSHPGQHQLTPFP